MGFAPTVSRLWFQSAPGGEAGGNSAAVGVGHRSWCFNPPPAVRPGETRLAAETSCIADVFQSAPGGEAGGNS